MYTKTEKFTFEHKEITGKVLYANDKINIQLTENKNENMTTYKKTYERDYFGTKISKIHWMIHIFGMMKRCIEQGQFTIDIQDHEIKMTFDVLSKRFNYHFDVILEKPNTNDKTNELIESINELIKSMNELKKENENLKAQIRYINNKLYDPIQQRGGLHLMYKPH
jgi:hypothetical protein